MEKSSDIFTAYFPLYSITLCLGYAPYRIAEKPGSRYFTIWKSYVLISSVFQAFVVICLNYDCLTWLEDLGRTSLLYQLGQRADHIANLLLIGSQMILSKLYANSFIQVNNFALQLLHEKIEITAAGFFDIDVKLIFSIAAAVTTYTILLVQLDPKLNQTFPKL
ncbi:hypothetical protein Trydic_g6285 [Trypoxylus dichotomus]